ncbi:winged helix-turn-helix domain-containing protein [Microbulbifer salipaludis]|uniref:Winged helix-turn-helix domain-containing protein n=1 Tax=Microbulbifer salipaludis TaxID=187980 RepID=A0ABS3E3C1_9GAMM|nr:tetratricopeptide repeat protein [Microbulbifer salipaludis]MBN8429802.1 winged helix-turn-helix domain-containing protein [Microbulbifer salipaludis]
MRYKNGNKLQIGDLKVDFGKWQAECGGRPVRLTNQSMQVLRVLVDAWPDTVTQQALIDAIWPGKVVTDQSVKQAVKRLRESLDPSSAITIKSVRGRGYRLDCEPVVVSQETRWSRLRVAAGVIAVALAVLGAWQFAQWKPAGSGHAESLTSSAEAYRLYLSGIDYYQRYREADARIAVAQFEKAIALDPEFAGAWAALSDAQAMLGEVDSAIASAQTAIAMAPGEASGHKALGHAYSMKGWFRRAIEVYAQTLELDPNNLAAISNTAFHWQELGQFGRAMQWNLRALRLDANNAIVYLHVAETFKGLGMSEQAREWYAKARNLRPDYPLLYHSLAYFLLRNGDIAGANETITAALELAPEHPDIVTAAGDIALYRGDYDQALMFYRRAVPLEPADKPAHYALLRTGQILQMQGHQQSAQEALKQARDIAEKLIAKGDEWPGNYVDIATCYAIEKDYMLAHGWLLRAQQAGWVDYQQVLQDPAFAEALSLPEYIRLQQELEDQVAHMRARVRQHMM